MNTKKQMNIKLHSIVKKILIIGLVGIILYPPFDNYFVEDTWCREHRFILDTTPNNMYYVRNFTLQSTSLAFNLIFVEIIIWVVVIFIIQGIVNLFSKNKKA